MKYILVLLLLSLFVFNAWFVVQESYWCNNLFIATKEIGLYAAVDFDCYYHACKRMIENKPVYDKSVGAVTYPPSFYLMFTPFVKMNLPDSFQLWTILKLITIPLTAWILSGFILQNGGIFRRVVTTMFLSLLIYVFSPTQDEIMNGQINLFILLFLSLSLYFVNKKQYVFCGIMLGLVFNIKLISLFLILYFIWKKNWKVVIPALCAILLFNIPVLIKFGTGIYSEYLNYLLRSKEAIMTCRNLSMYSQSYRFLQSIGVQNVWVVSRVVLFVFNFTILVVLYNLLKRNNGDNYLQVFSYIILCSMLLSPLNWSYHNVWLFISFAYLASEIWKNKETRIINTIGLITIYFALSFFDGMGGVGKWQWIKDIFLNARAPLIILIILWQLFTYNVVKSNQIF